jgi:tripartite-type tricarboxylate transporter receptor subunit TctC
MKAWTKLIAFLLMASCAGAVAAQQYPMRPVRMIVPFPPGGPVDVIGRFIAAKLPERLGQQVVVDNRSGAGGNIGMGIAAGAVPDGHTILLVSSNFVVNPGLYKKIPYDPYKSFAPVSNVAASPNLFTAHPSAPVKSISDLINLAKASPGKYSMATPGIGTTSDLSARLLALTAKLDLIYVPFAGSGPAVAAVLGNQMPFGCTGVPPAAPHIQAGRLRGLAVTSVKRSVALPDVPTMQEAGFKGQEADFLIGLFVPAGTPKAVVERLHSEVTRIVMLPDVKEKIIGLGFNIVASTPEQFAAQIKVEVERWTKVIKSSGIEVQ